eukprot:Hpha_TRINITY_DN15105_c6_g2::TRINITY_DN15105_c6_g2_i1::g.126887::m.126887
MLGGKLKLKGSGAGKKAGSGGGAVKRKAEEEAVLEGLGEHQSFQSGTRRSAAQEKLEKLRETEGEAGDVNTLSEKELKDHKKLLKLRRQGQAVDPISVYGDVNGGGKAVTTDASEYEKKLDRRCRVKHDKWCSSLA